MSKVHDNMIAARMAGHSWDDIHDHISAQFAAGASREDLGFAPVETFMNRTQQNAAREITVAASAANENSPFAWVQGRAPRGFEMNGYAGGSHTSIPPSSIGVQKGAIHTTPESEGPGSIWKATTPEFRAGDHPPTYGTGGLGKRPANENPRLREVEPEDLESKKQFLDGANRTVRDIEGALSGNSPNVNKGVDAVADDVKVNLRSTTIATTDEQN